MTHSGTAEKILHRNNIQLTDHFNLTEFECGCCGAVMLDNRLLLLLEKAREKVKCPLHINSGYRCPAYNKKVGGSPISQHMTGLAADVACPPEIKLVEFSDMFLNAGAVRVGMYVASEFLHIAIADQYKNDMMCSRMWRIM